MVMWIVLGSLIGVVLIFLIITTIRDKKKSNKIKIEKETLSKEIRAAGEIISKKVVEVINKNEKSVAKFVPSVGKVKMSEINKDARDTLKTITASKDFKLLKHNTDQYHTFLNHIKALTNERSNNWNKRNIEDIKFFFEYKAPKAPAPKTKKEAKAAKKAQKKSQNRKK